MGNTQIQSILKILGEQVPPSSCLLLVGGSGLVLLGSLRLTIEELIQNVQTPQSTQLLKGNEEILNLLLETVPVASWIFT